MPVAHKMTITFGLVNIPIGLYKSAQPHSISFNQLHKTCHSRIKYKKVCPNCNQEVGNDDIVKGYQYEKDNYVVLTDDELKKVASKNDKIIEIVSFVPSKELDPLLFVEAYYALPIGPSRPYELLLQAMKAENKVAIAKTIMGNKQTLVALLVINNLLIFQTLYFASELKAIPKGIKQNTLKEQEIKMARQLIKMMESSFDINDYEDTYTSKLLDAINKKISGKKIVGKKENKIIINDMISALEQSLKMEGDRG